ncbi:MAG: hypothetical protein BWY06_03451 [Candidatus Latescibacteria bacterium ADurb.Bin168]|nr:MAG: hypothetical protein BWY06_03451 [Candidatus Latescibacteria bacterium ADurb.Bin168]
MDKSIHVDDHAHMRYRSRKRIGNGDQGPNLGAVDFFPFSAGRLHGSLDVFWIVPAAEQVVIRQIDTEPAHDLDHQTITVIRRGPPAVFLEGLAYQVAE